MADAVYIFSAVISVACALLLLRSYRQTHSWLLLWSSLCFLGLTANNILLLIDLYAIPGISLAILRSATALVSLLLLLFGLLWNVRT